MCHAEFAVPLVEGTSYRVCNFLDGGLAVPPPAFRQSRRVRSSWKRTFLGIRRNGAAAPEAHHESGDDCHLGIRTGAFRVGGIGCRPFSVDVGQDRHGHLLDLVPSLAAAKTP